MVMNTDLEFPKYNLEVENPLKNLSSKLRMDCKFSTDGREPLNVLHLFGISKNSDVIVLDKLKAGECRIYKINQEKT
jgi:hypothetical protein